ncbi:hypothetical protein OIU76_011764 [Salix suchowensis]|nr:hypothetical protein OIU76_011764 [Salix suchowensis]
MSSLAAARADNFYYPPEWPPKKGGLNKFHGQHALRERARKFDQGLLIISWGKHAYRAFQVNEIIFIGKSPFL